MTQKIIEKWALFGLSILLVACGQITQPRKGVGLGTGGASSQELPNEASSPGQPQILDAIAMVGAVQGLDGILQIRVNEKDLSIENNGSFTFYESLNSNVDLNVSIVQNPTGQICMFQVDGANDVTSFNHTLAGQSFSELTLQCNYQKYTVAGNVQSTDLNNGDPIISSLIGPISIRLSVDNVVVEEKTLLTGTSLLKFTTTIPHKSQYLIEVTDKGIHDSCTITASSGTIKAHLVNNVEIDCQVQFPT